MTTDCLRQFKFSLSGYIALQLFLFTPGLISNLFSFSVVSVLVAHGRFQVRVKPDVVTIKVRRNMTEVAFTVVILHPGPPHPVFIR